MKKLYVTLIIVGLVACTPTPPSRISHMMTCGTSNRPGTEAIYGRNIFGGSGMSCIGPVLDGAGNVISDERLFSLSKEEIVEFLVDTNNMRFSNEYEHARDWLNHLNSL